MTEPRMRTRPKGAQFSAADLSAFLTAFGDDFSPLPETVRCLDEIVTDFIIETAHVAAQSATYSHRAKIKVDDFKFALRRDPKKLGRVVEMLEADKEIKKKRKAFDTEEGMVVSGAAGGAGGGADGGGEGVNAATLAPGEGVTTDGRRKKRGRQGERTDRM